MESESMEQNLLISMNSQENNYNRVKMNRTDGNGIQRFIIKTQPNEFDEEYDRNSIISDDITNFVQERIKQEPIDIKNEPLESDEENNDSNEICHNNDHANSKFSEEPQKQQRESEPVKTTSNMCYICNTNLENRSDLRKHLKSHNAILPYKCLRCSTETHPIMYTSVYPVNKHLQSHRFRHGCLQCPLRFRYRRLLSFHVDAIHLEQSHEYPCDTCGKVFTNIYSFRYHIRIHKQSTKQFKCENCGEYFPSRYWLRKHQTVLCKRQPVSLCETANKSQPETNSFELSSKQTDHNVLKRNENGIADHPSSTLEPTSTDESNIETSNKEENRTEEQTELEDDSNKSKSIANYCYICDTLLGSETDFNDHLEYHKEMLPYKCPQCSTETNPKNLYTVLSLNKHFETHGFSYTCPYCPLRHRDKSSYSYHIQSMHNDKVKVLENETNEVRKQHKCEFCPDSFERRKYLLQHERVNHKIQRRIGRPSKKHPQKIKCHICDTILENKSVFDEHIESHKSMLPYECSQCSTETNPIRVNTTTSLNKHFQRHKFHYKCPHCPLRFRTDKTMMVHAENTHEAQNRQLSCEICRKVYTNMDGYRRHVSIHRDTSANPARDCLCQDNIL